MASVEPTNTLDVVAGANPDSVAPSVRPWRLSPLRDRQGTTPPDYTDNGLDVRIHGDPDTDGTAVTVLAGLLDTARNGLKRTNTEGGDQALWAEPAPRTYDTSGASAGLLAGTQAPAGPAATESSLGVAADHVIAVGATDLPLVIRPVVTVLGALFESSQATLQAVITTIVDGGSPTEVTRDLFYGFGGSTTLVLPTGTVGQGGSLDIEVDLQLVYREEVTAAFDIAVAGCQVTFQTWEYTSSEAAP